MAESHENSIAVIGMAGRFPGAPDVKSFWRNLEQGVESVRHFTEEELRANGLSDEAIADPNYVKAYPVIDGAALFDARYFNFSAKEVEYIDPQHRLFLECAVHALEDAGCDPKRFDGNIGVFGGTNPNSYQLLSLHNRILSGAFGSTSRVFETLDSDLMFFLGGDKDYLATRVSYKLDLRGPSLTVQTACSTSLVAVHLACQSLIGGECEVALAGGVSITPASYVGLGYSVYSGMTSPDAHCRPFDAGANGTVFGDGAGIVVLKRLDRAIADGDNIRGVIRGSAINNDGSSKVGYAAPSLEGQAAVIVEALAVAGIPASTINYVEAHGTGTPLGDPIEVASLTRAFRNSTQQSGFCGLGSVKSNIGHLNTAAGVAALIKVIMAMEHERLPPSINFKAPNPQIDFDDTPFVVVSSPREWPRGDAPRRAGVNAFGIGGTNAHVVVEEPPLPRRQPSRKSWHVLPISAKTETALATLSNDLADHLSTNRVELADVAHSLANGRAAHKYRRAIVCRDAEAAIDALRTAQGISSARETCPVYFMFPGQGSQRLNMGRSLYHEEPAYRAAFDNCADLLRGVLNVDLRSVVFGQDLSEEEAAARLTMTEYAQPAIFAVSFAMAELWKSRGIQPAGMIGHSVGELAAACVAGVLSLKDALKVVAHRGQIMQRQPGGRMLVIPARFEKVQAHVGKDLSVAAVNAPDALVVAGPGPAIADLAGRLRQLDLSCVELHTSHAFHSAMMDAAVAPFVELMRGIRLQAPTIPYLSNVTGTWITPEQATDPEYWGQQIRATVRFADGIETILAKAPGVLLEVGPGRSLSTLARQNVVTGEAPAIVVSMPKPGDAAAEGRAFHQAIAEMWMAGCPIAWEAQYSGETRIKSSLPSYPFERQRYWPVFASRSEAGRGPSAQPRSTAGAQGTRFTMAPYWRSVNHASGSDGLQLRGQKWLLFSAGDEVSQALVDDLRSKDVDLAVVRMGASYAHSGVMEFSLSPSETGDFDRLLADLEAKAFLPQTIVYLWSLGVPQVHFENLAPVLDRTFFGLTYLVQAMARREMSAPLKIASIVSQTVDVLGGEAIDPTGAITRGPCLVVPLEHRHISCVCFDIPAPNALLSEERPHLAEALVLHIAGDETPGLLAYRRGRVWSQAVERVPMKPVDETRPVIRQGGSYLITGGLGELGLAVAAAFAEQGAANLVLSGRTQMPPRAEWPQYLAESTEQDDRVAKIITAIQAIEAKGANVIIGTADVSDRVAMRGVVEEARAVCGPIHGVIHAAGIAGHNILVSQKRDGMMLVLLPKIAGMLTIDDLFASEPLDFIVLFSSLSAITGGVGMIDYVAGNAYLDATAAARAASRRGPKVISINWDIWSEIGMGTRLPRGFKGAGRVKLAEGISTSEGIDVLMRALQGDLRQVIVSRELSRQLDGRRGQDAPFESWEATDSSDVAQGQQSTNERRGRPDISAKYVEPTTEIEQVIAEFWADVLNLERVGIDDDFFELGGDSLLAMQMIPKLISRFQIDLVPRDLYEAGTVVGIARVIEAKLIEEIEKLEDA